MENITQSDSYTNCTLLYPDNIPLACYDVFRQIKFYMLIIIIPVGIVTNILSLSIFFTSSLKKQTTAHYLISLAFADIFLLLGELLNWINTERIRGEPLLGSFMTTHDLWCKLIMYIRYAGRLWSSWLVVVITVERYIAIAFPHRVSLISTPFKAKIFIIIEMLLSFTISIFPFFTVGVYTYDNGQYNMTGCFYYNTEEYKIASITIMGLGELFVPSVVVCIATALIIVTLRKPRMFRRYSMRENSPKAQLTTMLLAVAIVFLAMRLPYLLLFHIDMLKFKIWSPPGETTKFVIYASKSVAYSLAVLNYSINFFLYCLCGSTFRNAFKRLYGCMEINNIYHV